MPISFDFDFKNPNYIEVFRHRAEKLMKIREKPALIPALKAFYKANPAQFIIDWGVTYDPRNPERGLPTLIPFLLFPKQEDWVDYILRKWKAQERGFTEKSRDCGLSWLSVGLACTLCIFNRGLAIGFGSRKAEYVDLSGSMKALFPRAREFVKHLPIEFRGGCDVEKNSPFMRMAFPDTHSSITGESGDGIGRGDRSSIYFVDESAFLEHPQLVEASLSQTTNCRQDISTPNGRGNPFAENRFSGKFEVFTFSWRDDPRKSPEWYAKQVRDLDSVTLAAEVDLDYSASVEGILIPAAWVQAAVDAHLVLGFQPSGRRIAALDVADEGKDVNAFCGAHGVVVELLEDWSGKGDDIFGTVSKAFSLCDQFGYKELKYDADGLGAGVRGDARTINANRQPPYRIEVTAFRGSGEVFRKEKEDVKGRKNKDFFANHKAQSWWALRLRFQNTYRAVVEGMKYDKDELISLPKGLANLGKLIAELSQPTYSINLVGKIVIEKAPDGSKSPNLADSVMIRFAPGRVVMKISDTAMAA